MKVTVLTKESLREIKHDIINAFTETLDKKPEIKKWLTTAEVCNLLDISVSSLQTLRSNDTLKFQKVGWLIYYDHEHIVKVLEENCVNRKTKRLKK
jgi:hypothetical protein